MICKKCRSGADIPAIKDSDVLLKKMLHGQCRGGTWCDCLHRVVRKSIVNVNR